jgi:hypothetical protein
MTGRGLVRAAGGQRALAGRLSPAFACMSTYLELFVVLLERVRGKFLVDT